MGIEHELKDPIRMIIQVVNTHGIMKGGVAKGIADRYPIVLSEYLSYCNQIKDKALGTVQVVDFTQPELEDPTRLYYVANLFAIGKPNFDWYKETERTRVLSYPALFDSLSKLAQYIRMLPIDHSTFHIAVPTNMGCLRGGAHWDIVKEAVDYHLGFTNLFYYV